MNDDPERLEAELPASLGSTKPVIVAIGASSTSLPSIGVLLRSLAGGNDSAVVLVLQHREALDEAALGEIVQAAGGDLISAIDRDTPIEAGKLYLAAPNIVLTVEDGRFLTRPAQQEPGMRGTIDSFFLSLAADGGDRAVGVVLQGTGGDGTLGLTALKEQGGLTIAERGEQDTPGEISVRNAPGAIADFLVSTREIPERIRSHLLQLREAQQQAALEPAEVRPDLGRVASILQKKLGHDFHGYKPGTFMRRVQRRMQVKQVNDIESYIDLLREDGDEVQDLFNDLLIGVTQFFRDKREFELLEKQVIPRLFEGKRASDQLRVWVLGCATGEEAYSIAMLLRERLAQIESAPQMQIFATDIDVRALAAARVGRFPKTIAADLSPERLARWFVKEGDTYCVAKELREMCIFSSHNVIKDAPFSRLDLVSCRNLLIYMNPELQERVMPLFHFALRPGGFLFLGNSENATRHTKLFEPVDRRSRIFRRLETGTRVLPDFPIATFAARRTRDLPASIKIRPQDGSLARQAERIVERFAPAYVIVGHDNEIVHFSAGMGRYLGPTSGTASLDLINLVHRDLRVDLRIGLQKARSQEEPVEIGDISMRIDGSDAVVELNIQSVPDTGGDQRNLVVIFRDGVLRPQADRQRKEPDALQDKQVERLETDLRATRERLQATIEELESTNEELKSSNEEYQSLNEELQSANEELETSKEELQSLNEELTTVNGELSHRVHDLTRATSDLKNLLESTQIPTVFLDNDLKLMNFTPAATELFHLVETDIGRPFSHIKARIPVDDLYEDVRKVMRTLVSVEHPVDNMADGRSYIVRVLPYRSVDNFFAGVVVTFTDVTRLTRAERALRESEARFRAIFDNAAEYAIITMDKERKVTGWNPGARNLLGWDENEVMGCEADVIFTDEDRKAGAPEREAAAAAEYGFAADERWHQRKDGSKFWGSGTLRAVEDGSLSGFLKIFHDRTEAREATERQQLLLSELQHRVRNTLTIVRSINRMTAKSSTSVEEYAENLDGRLSAFSRVQTALTRDPAAGVDLRTMILDELLAYSEVKDSDRIQISGAPIILQPKAAEAFALAVHELATNAVKHGALSTPSGKIKVGWRMKKGGADRLIFEWAETGVALKKKDKPSKRGSGIELVEHGLSYQLDSTTKLEFEDGGLRCTIELPADDRVVLVDSV